MSAGNKPLAIKLAENLRGLQGRKSSKTACEAADELMRLAGVERERDEILGKSVQHEVELVTIKRERNALRAEVERLKAQPGREPVALTRGQIASACVRYRHDFALLSEEQRHRLMYEAIEWDRALQKERALSIPTAAAQPPVEPVAHRVTGKLGDMCSFHSSSVRKGDLVYTAPPTAARVPLTPAQQHADELLAVLKAGRDDIALAAASWDEDENRQVADFHRDRVLTLMKRVDAVIKDAGQEGGAA